jgi:hypothetical protein
MLVAVAAVIAGGCAAPLGLNDPTARVAPARLVGLPPAIRTFELDAGREVSVLSEAARAAREAVEPAVAFFVTSLGGHVVSLEQLKGLEEGHELMRWALKTLQAIGQESLLRHDGHTTPHSAVSDWRYPGSLASLRAGLDADFILLTLFLDGRHTAGRTVANDLAQGFGGTSVHAKREAEACVVDLGDGRVVWCAFEPLARVDLTQAGAAHEVVARLLTGLYEKAGQGKEMARLRYSWRAPQAPR